MVARGTGACRSRPSRCHVGNGRHARLWSSYDVLMFKSFFLSRRWLPWSVLGSFVILFGTWYRVQLDVKINEWFGTFYDMLQKALAAPNSITADQFWAQVMTFTSIAMVYITIAVLMDFLIKHYVFRWRTAMNDHYADRWGALRGIEGAAEVIAPKELRERIHRTAAALVTKYGR